MSEIILLDTGPLGLITHPKASHESDQCNQWMRGQLQKGVRVLVPGISDYELRREMLLNSSTKGIIRLDALKKSSWLYACKYCNHGSGSSLLGSGENNGQTNCVRCGSGWRHDPFRTCGSAVYTSSQRNRCNDQYQTS